MGQAISGSIAAASFVGRLDIGPSFVELSMFMLVIGMMRVHRELRRKTFMPGQMRTPGSARYNQRTKEKNKGKSSNHMALC